MSQASTPQASLFDDALNPAPAAPLAQSHEPRPDPAVLTEKPSGGYSAKDIEVLEGLKPGERLHEAEPHRVAGGIDGWIVDGDDQHPLMAGAANLRREMELGHGACAPSHSGITAVA